jgi:hypothetical protein
MSSQISRATRRLAAALALAAVVTLGVSVASPADAASAASPSTRTYSAESGASAVDAGSVDTSDRRLPTGRLYIAPRYFDREYRDGAYGIATDLCNSYHLGDQCIKSIEKLFTTTNVVNDDECQAHGMDAVIPYIQYSRCRKS